MTAPTAQLDAFARRTDPKTSHEAAARVSAAQLETLVIQALRTIGPATSRQVADYLGRDLVSISPRFAPLSRKSQIRRTGGRSGRAELWAAV